MPRLTSRQHECAFAHAVVVVCVLRAEVSAVQDQAALPPRSPCVAFQIQPAVDEETGRNRGQPGVQRGRLQGGLKGFITFSAP